MPSLVELLYGGGTGNYVSSQTNQNGAGIVELEDVAAASPYSTFGGMYALNGAAPATTTNTIASPDGGGAAGPSAEYVAMMAEKYPGTAWGVGDRPSLFHQFIPGMGWVFMPEYDEGNNLSQQYQNMTPAQYTDAMDNGYTHQMSAASQAAANATGTTMTTGPAYVGGSWNNPANAVQTTTPSTTGSTGGTEDDFPYTLADINALYLELLGRDGNPEYMEYWLNDLRNGQTLEQVRANIMLSPEYIKRQEDLANGGDTPPATGGPDGGETKIKGWYWGNSGGTWQWFSYIEGEAPPAGAHFELGEAMPNGQPAGWTDPNAGNTTTPTEPPPEPKLYSPTKDQFFQGMFSANDLMFRDGGTVSSTYYDNLRQGILDSLAQTALDNGRTQNTAEEIALAQGGYNGYSATGLFDPAIAGTAQALGLY